jgi:hypothetical protein
MSRRRRNDEPRTSNEEVERRLQQIRQINADADAGRISWEERVRRHEQLVEGIGPLDDPRHDRPNGRQK